MGENNPFYGKQHTKETKQKMSEKIQGRIPWNKGLKGVIKDSEETKEKKRQARLGKKHTEATKKKIGDKHKNKVVSEETRKKLSEYNLGKTYEQIYGEEKAEETRKKLSDSHKRLWENEEYRKQRLEYFQSDEWKQIRSEAQKILWQNEKYREMMSDGDNESDYDKGWTEELREFIRQRDNFTCQECGVTQDKLGRKLSVHHIDFNKQDCSEENLISLCNSCHALTKAKGFREIFIEKYIAQIAELYLLERR